MLAAMDKYFPPHATYTKPEGGMFIWVTMENGASALEKFQEAMAQKVAFVPGYPFYIDKTGVNTMRLNYTNATPEIIEEGAMIFGITKKSGFVPANACVLNTLQIPIKIIFFIFRP